MDEFREAQQMALEQERMREALEVLERVDQRKHTSADVIYLAAELGVLKQFSQDKRRVA